MHEPNPFSEREEKPVQLGKSIVLSRAEENKSKTNLSKEKMIKWRIFVAL